MNTQVEQIKAEIERWKKELRLSTSCEAKYRREMLDDISEFIDSLQEESVSEDLEEASKEWLSPQLDKSYATYGETKQMELTHFDGYAMLDAIEFGAKWQKEQMIKDAINAHIAESFIPVSDSLGSYLHGFTCTYEEKQSTPYVKVGDKVKLIIVKEEE